TTVHQQGVLETKYERHKKKLIYARDKLNRWQEQLCEMAEKVQRQMEEFTPIQAVYNRDRLLALMEDTCTMDGQIDRAYLESEMYDLADEVRPPLQFAQVLLEKAGELGCRRGHVKVISDPFSSNGVVWQAEIRRVRNHIGDACLVVNICQIDGHIDKQLYNYEVKLLRVPTTSGKDRSPTKGQIEGGAAMPIEVAGQLEWSVGESQAFEMCTMCKLAESGILNDKGSLLVQFGLAPLTYRQLAHSQSNRIAALERQLSQMKADRDSCLSSPESGADIDRARQRRKSDAGTRKGWVTSPRHRHHYLRRTLPGLASHHHHHQIDQVIAQAEKQEELSSQPSMGPDSLLSSGADQEDVAIGHAGAARTVSSPNSARPNRGGHPEGEDLPLLAGVPWPSAPPAKKDNDSHVASLATTHITSAKSQTAISPLSDTSSHRHSDDQGSTKDSVTSKRGGDFKFHFPSLGRNKSSSDKAPEKSSASIMSGSSGHSNPFLQRLSGWVKTKENRLVKKYRKVMPLASHKQEIREEQEVDPFGPVTNASLNSNNSDGTGGDDWSFLDRPMTTPAFVRSRF
ncbi:hypothetical protein EV182_005120, partial [Spiromyces aspiralis]